MIDTAKLRALLAAATLRPWEVDDDHTPCIWGHEGSLVVSPVVETPADAALIAAAVNGLPALLDELEALRAVVERGGHLSWAAAEPISEHLKAWRTATGCDTPEEAARVVSVFDEATHLARGQREELITANRDLGRLAMRQQAELDRLRELRDALLAWCASTRVAHVRDTREEQRLDRAIAAEHAARAKKEGG